MPATAASARSARHVLAVDQPQADEVLQAGVTAADRDRPGGQPGPLGQALGGVRACWRRCSLRWATSDRGRSCTSAPAGPPARPG